jgi:hypothetical protein
MLKEEGAKSVFSHCPYPKCKCIVNEVAFKKLCTEESYKRYENYMLRSFVEDNQNVLFVTASYLFIDQMVSVPCMYELYSM